MPFRHLVPLGRMASGAWRQAHRVHWCVEQHPVLTRSACKCLQHQPTHRNHATPHRTLPQDRVERQPNNLVTQQPTHDMDSAGLPRMPDIEGNEASYDVVYYDADPGDVIVHNMYTIHGSTGNTGASGRRRMAASIRYLGDDIRYKPKASNMTREAFAG